MIEPFVFAFKFAFVFIGLFAGVLSAFALCFGAGWMFSWSVRKLWRRFSSATPSQKQGAAADSGGGNAEA